MGKWSDLQRELAERVVLEDRFDPPLHFGGVDISYISRNKGIAAMVVIDEKFRIIEEKWVEGEIKVPYIHGFLSFRELPLMKKTIENIENRPQITFVSGNGILHPRFLGIASHLGVELDISTIGIAKKLLCGELKEDKIICKDRIVGIKFGNIYVSPGNRISIESALKYTKKMMGEHRLPEPLYLADKLSREIAEDKKQRTKVSGSHDHPIF